MESFMYTSCSKQRATKQFLSPMHVPNTSSSSLEHGHSLQNAKHPSSSNSCSDNMTLTFAAGCCSVEVERSEQRTSSTCNFTHRHCIRHVRNFSLGRQQRRVHQCMRESGLRHTRRSALTQLTQYALSFALLSSMPLRVDAVQTAGEAYMSAKAARTMLFSLLEGAVAEGMYDTFRLALRSGALGRIRSSCAVLCENVLESSAKADAKKRYRAFVSLIERADGFALRASRGGDTAVVAPSVRSALDALDEFLNLLPEAVLEGE